MEAVSHKRNIVDMNEVEQPTRSFPITHHSPSAANGVPAVLALMSVVAAL